MNPSAVDLSADPDAARTVDLNADLGESFGAWTMGDDAALLALVSSANIACGFHAGDPLTLSRTCAEAVARGVSIGAHVSYRDLAGFGRRFVDVDPAELTAEVIYQTAALDGMARAAGGRVRYLKPHGALYNTIVHHEAHARAVVDAVLAHDAALPVLGLPGSVFLRIAADAGLRTVPEAFADRAYTPAGTLVSRREPGAVLHDPQEVADRMLSLVTSGTITNIAGGTLAVAAESICVHGDSPGAVALAQAVRDALTTAGVHIAPFAP